MGFLGESGSHRIAYILTGASGKHHTTLLLQTQQGIIGLVVL